MDFLYTLMRDMGKYLASGGFIMPPMVVATVLLWLGIGYRLVYLKRGSKDNLRVLLKDEMEGKSLEASGFVTRAVKDAVRVKKNYKGDIHRYLDETLFSLSERMRRYRTLVRTIVLVAPLAGLLGTVSGMIEMFDSLGSQTFNSQTGGIAGGISQALFTTQFGLVISVPGMIIGRTLDNREDSMREEMDQIKEFLCGAAQEEGA